MDSRRAASVLLRTAHLGAFAVLLGGHVFDVEPQRLVPWLAATVVTGAGMAALEVGAGVDWLGTGKGLAVLVKLGLLATVPVFWGHRVAILFAVVVVAGVASHMPRRFRHRQIVRVRRAGA
jgi:hypothetical protein